LPVTKADLEEATKKNGWFFDWKMELSELEHQVYKLVTETEKGLYMLATILKSQQATAAVVCDVR